MKSESATQLYVVPFRIVLILLCLVVCAFLPNALDSSLLRLPLYVLGVSLAGVTIVASWIRERRVTLLLTSVHVFIALHIPLFLFSAIFHRDPLYTGSALAFDLANIGAFFLGSIIFRNGRDLQRFFSVLEWLTLALCLVAGAQIFLRDQLPFEFFLGHDPRVSSVLGNSVFFSSYLVVVIPLIVARVWHLKPSATASRFRIILIAMAVWSLYATQTRSSQIACFVAVVAMISVASTRILVRRIAGGVMVGFALVVLALAMSNGFRARLHDTFDTPGRSTLARRYSFWESGEAAFAASPWTGLGIGQLEPAVLHYRSADYWETGSEDIVPHAHNELVEIGVEFGVIGLVLAGITLTLIFLRSVKLGRESPGDKQWMAIGIFGALAGIAADNLANVSLRQPSIAILVWILMGALCSPLWKRSDDRTVSWSLPLPRFAAVGVIIVWCLFAVWYGGKWTDRIVADTVTFRGIQEQIRDPNTSIRDLQLAVTRNPYHLLARSYLARGYILTMRWEDALRTTDDLLNISPLYPRASLIRAYALYRLGRQREALESVDKELLVRSHPETEELRKAILNAH